MKTSLLILAFFSSSVLAAAKCDFESITNSCKMFDPPGNKIPLKDGTYIPKIKVLIDEAAQNSDKPDWSDQEKNYGQMIDAQLEMLKILEEVPAGKLSTQAKFVISNAAGIYGGIFDPNYDQYAATLPKNVLPWPLGAKNAKVQAVDPIVVRNELRKILTPSQQRRMQTIFEKMTQGAAGQYSFRPREKHSLSEEMRNISAPRRARAESLVELVRTSMIKNIVGTRPKEQWSPEETAAVEKINAIEYRAGDNPNVKNTPYCQGVLPNAFYDPASNTINLCTNFYNFPDSTIVAVLGHEMGHAVDPCGCQTHFHSIDQKKLEGLWAGGQLPKDIEKDEDLSTMATMLGQIGYSGTKVTAFPFEHYLNDPSKIEYFKKAGILNPGPGKVRTFKQDGNSLEGYFLNDVYKCLLSNTDGSFRQTTLAEIEEAAETVVNKRREVAGSGFDAKKEKRRIVQAFIRYPQCYSPRSQTQMGEAVSDWFGSKALGEFLATQKLESQEDRLAPFAFFAAAICLERSGLEKPVTTVAGTADEVRKDLRKDAGFHPASIMRLEKVMLADPRVRAAMGCSGETIASTCSHSIGGSQTSGEAGARQ